VENEDILYNNTLDSYASLIAQNRFNCTRKIINIPETVSDDSIHDYLCNICTDTNDETKFKNYILSILKIDRPDDQTLDNFINSFY
jgi:hypothetical protein